MRFQTFTATTLFGMVLSVAAQNIRILHPTTGQTVQSGQDLTIEIIESLYPEGQTEVGVAFALKDCPGGSNVGLCDPSVSEYLGTLLLVSSYDLQAENYTVTIPAGYKGTAVLNAAHFYILGASSLPVTDITNVTITIV